MSKIARLLGAGEYRTPNSSLPVCYIVFELAHRGDVRRQAALVGKLTLAIKLRTLHHIAVALQQLHGEGIAHQDLKPSNVLIFEDFEAKLSDLGCADLMANPSQSPRGHLPIAGDFSYAPPELFYGELAPEWKIRRFGCDLYLLGNLVIFFFSGGASMTSIMWTKLHPSHSPNNWTHDFRSVLPYIRDAFEKALADVIITIPECVRKQLEEIVRYLCEPDPRRRGHPTDLDCSQFNLERVISAFNLLATKAEFELIRE